MISDSSVGNFIKKRFSSIYSIFFDALIDNSDDRALGRRGYLFANYCTSIIGTMVGGIFFTSLMLEMNAGDVYIGYINMIISSCTLMQLLSPIIFERLAKRKKLLLTLKTIQNFLNIVFISIVPFLPVSKTLQLALFMLTVVIINALNSFCAPGLSIWWMQSLPHERRANFFTVISYGSVITNTISLLAAILVDKFETDNISFTGISPTFCAFFILRAVAVITAVLEFKFLLQIKEYPYEVTVNKKQNISLLFLPLKNLPFMLTISIVFFWNFMGGLIGQYYTVYVLDIVEMSYTYLRLSCMIATPLIIIMTPIWAKLINKHSWFKMLGIGMLGYSLALAANAFVVETTQFMYVIVMIFCYLFNPAININFSNIPYIKMPNTNQTAYLSFYSLFTVAGTIIGNFVGIQIFALTQGKIITLFGMEMLNYQYMCILQALLVIPIAGYVIFVRHKLLKDPANAKLNL